MKTNSEWLRYVEKTNSSNKKKSKDNVKERKTLWSKGPSKKRKELNKPLLEPEELLKNKRDKDRDLSKSIKKLEKELNKKPLEKLKKNRKESEMKLRDNKRLLNSKWKLNRFWQNNKLKLREKDCFLSQEVLLDKRLWLKKEKLKEKLMLEKEHSKIKS